VTRAVLAFSAALLLAACMDTRPFNGVEMLPPETAMDLTLPTAGEESFSLQEQKGKVVLLFFGFTNCPDICPTTLSDWARARQSLGADADRVTWVFVSVDPERDTPEVASNYAKKFDPSFIGLSADAEAIARIQQGFRISAYREAALEDDGPYSVAHSSQTFLVDRGGRLRIIYPFGFTADELAEDLKRLL